MFRPSWRAALSLTKLPSGAAAGELLLVPNASASENGGAFPAGNFRDMNGMICPFPDGSGRFVSEER